MATGNIIYTFHIAIIFTLLLSSIFIVAVRGYGKPLVYFLLYQSVSALFVIINLFQTAHTPIYGQALWNPLHLLLILTVYPFLFAYISGMLNPAGTNRRFWLTAYLPLAALVTLYLFFEARYGKLPLFSRYAELRNCLNMPQLWVLFVATVFSVAMIGVMTVRAIVLLRLHRRNIESYFARLNMTLVLITIQSAFVPKQSDNRWSG